MSIDVSIIIPSYNYAHFLDDCIQSVLCQNGVSYEIIVVDDGSTDDTGKLVEKYNNKIRYIYQDNKGLSSARNTGIKLAKGKYIQFLDADDLLDNNCLYNKFRTLESLGNNFFLVCRNTLFSDFVGGKIKTRGEWQLYTKSLDIHLCRLNLAPPHAYFISRENVLKTGFFNESYTGCEDYDYWLRVLGKGVKPVFCKNARVFYRIHNNSMGASKKKRGAFSFDVLVHEKKYNNEYGDGVTDVLEKLDGKLAFVDGMLHTAVCIDSNVNQKGQEKMLGFSKEYLQEICDILDKNIKPISIESRLYILRILLRKKQVLNFNNQELSYLVNKLDRYFSDKRMHLSSFLKALPLCRYEQRALISSQIKKIKVS